MKSGAKGAEKFLSTKIGRFFSIKYMANDDFSEPPRRPDSKNPIFFFSRFLGLGHLQGLGIRLSRILGVLSIEPFVGEGGGPARGLYPPPPPRNENPASLVFPKMRDRSLSRSQPLSQPQKPSMFSSSRRGARLAWGSIRSQSIQIQATEWYLNCANEEPCRAQAWACPKHHDPVFLLLHFYYLCERRVGLEGGEGDLEGTEKEFETLEAGETYNWV